MNKQGTWKGGIWIPNPKGNNQHTPQQQLVRNIPKEVMSKEEMYERIRELSQDIIKYQHIIRPKMAERSILLKKYFKLEEV